MQKTAKDNYEKKQEQRDRNYFKQQNSDWILKRENRELNSEDAKCTEVQV